MGYFGLEYSALLQYLWFCYEDPKTINNGLCNNMSNILVEICDRSITEPLDEWAMVMPLVKPGECTSSIAISIVIRMIKFFLRVMMLFQAGDPQLLRISIKKPP